MLNGCKEYRPRLIELARGAASVEEREVLMAHVESCAPCARALDEQLALSGALDAMAGEAVPTLQLVEARVLAEFDRVVGRRRMARWIPVMGLAAAALFGVVMLQHRTAAVPARVQETAAAEPAVLPAPEVAHRTTAPIVQVAHKPRKQTADDNQPFLPIPYTVPLGPEERTSIVRMEIPVAALIAAGFDVPVVDPGALVLADVLVGQDGRARAIRPVRVSAGK